MEKFLETCNLLSLNLEETENVNGPIACKGIKTVIKNLPTKKSRGPNGFIGEFHQKFKLTSTLLKLFQKYQRGLNTPKFIL